MPFVLDCSMTMSWIFSDEATESTDAVRDSLHTDYAIVPSLWSIEVGNVLLAATRRGRIRKSDWSRLNTIISALPIQVDPESTDRILKAVLPLAHKTNLSVYDAMYLELAVRQNLPMATLDNALSAACKDAGVKLL